MKGFAKKSSRGEKGFTLVELLIVFTLLGILAAIMIPNVSGLVGYGQTQLNSTDYVADIAAVTQSVPEEALFTALEIGSDWIFIYGRAYTPATVVRFARNLELIGDFSKADIQRIEWANSTIGPSLSFTIVVTK